jgi:PAS domain S-box-containing protein
VIYVNSGFERITGYRKEDIIGKNCRCLQGTDTKQAALEELRRAMAEARESQVVLRNYRKDGSMFWNEFCLTPVRDETGYLTHFIGIQTDISERKQAEEALRESEERFRGLVNSAPVGIFQTDLLGDCLFVNSRWLDIAERSREETLGTGWENAIHPNERLSVFSQWYDAAARGREFAMECSFLTPQGKVKWVYSTAVPLRNTSGAITGYLGSVKDISDRKQAEEALQLSEVREREKAKELELTLSELKRTQAQLIQAEKMSGRGTELTIELPIIQTKKPQIKEVYAMNTLALAQ